jgi:restriction system protein
MDFKMKENSLFAVLLRSPWWVSFVVAAGMFALLKFFIPTPYAAFGTLPFLVIAAIASWRQLRAPSARQVAARLDAMRALSREEFAAALADAFRRQGYGVSAVRAGPAELELTRAGRVSLVAWRRWKATYTGIEPLRELHAAAQAREAHECLYLASGEVTAAARAFAAQKNIRLLAPSELVQFFPRGKG